MPPISTFLWPLFLLTASESLEKHKQMKWATQIYFKLSMARSPPSFPVLPWRHLHHFPRMIRHKISFTPFNFFFGWTVGICSEYRNIYIGAGVGEMVERWESAILLTFWAQHSILVAHAWGNCVNYGASHLLFGPLGIYGWDLQIGIGIVIEREDIWAWHSFLRGRQRRRTLIKCSRTWLFITRIYGDFMAAPTPRGASSAAPSPPWLVLAWDQSARRYIWYVIKTNVTVYMSIRRVYHPGSGSHLRLAFRCKAMKFWLSFTASNAEALAYD